MAVANLNTLASAVASRDLDNLVVRESYTERDGGVTLDVTGFTKPYIRGGHVVIRTVATPHVYKPMPLNAGGTAYASLPADNEYYGHTVQTVKTSLPTVGVMYNGKINPIVGKDASAQSAGYYDLTAILTDLKTALTHIMYEGDNA